MEKAMNQTQSVCTFCGAPLKPGLRECEFCGAAVDAGSKLVTTPAPPLQVEQEMPDEYLPPETSIEPPAEPVPPLSYPEPVSFPDTAQSTSPTSSRRVWLWVFVAVLAVILICLCIGVVGSLSLL
jgi:hypothetical protein